MNSRFFLCLAVASVGLVPQALWAASPSPTPIARSLSFTDFVFINGGGRPAINYSVHEQDLLAFKNGLFFTGDPSAIHLLNAGGEGTQVVKILPNGELDRDKDGNLNFSHSIIRDHFQAATKKNIRSEFERIRTRNPQRLTVIYGDHGNERGVVLWKEAQLTADGIRENNSILPNSTLIRSLHLECYGGASVVDPERKLPDEPSKFDAFFKHYYPKNRCALALAHENELGQYYSFEKDWKESPWLGLLRNGRIPSLRSIKEAIDGDADFIPSPVLTTDYFLKDLTDLYCRAAEKNPRSPVHALDGIGNACYPEGTANFSVVETAHQQWFHVLCQTEKSLADQLNRTINRYHRYIRVVNDYKGVRSYWIEKYGEEKYPHFMKSYEEAKTKIEALQARLELGGKTRTEASALRQQINDLQAQVPAQYNSWATNSRNQKVFDEYFHQHFTNEWLKANSTDYPDLSYARFFGKNAEVDLDKLKSSVLDWEDEEQSKIKSEYRKLYQDRRFNAELLMSDPRLSKIKERYENLKSCENSSLR